MKLNILKSLIIKIHSITIQDLELFEEYFNISNIKTKLDEIKYKQKSLNLKKQFGLNIKKTISKYLMDENFSDLEKKIYNVWLLFRNKTNPKKYNNHRFKTNNN